MTLAIEAGLNPGDLALQAIPVTEGGGSDFVSLASATTYAHRAMTTATGGYAALSTTLETALNGASGLSETYTVTWDPFAGFYTISATGAFSIGFGTLAPVFGFPTLPGSATSHSSTLTPTHVIVTDKGNTSNESDEYEPDDITEGAVTEDGTPFSVSPVQAPRYRDFRVPFEPKSAVFLSAGGSDWTWEDFFTSVRGDTPFSVWDGTAGTVHVLRAGATHFAPVRVVDGWDDRWSLDLETHQLGAVG